MSLYRPFTNGKIGVVDLTTRSAYTVDLSEDLCRDRIGGASLNAQILSEYESDSLVFGTGPLTGSFAPALLAAAPGRERGHQQDERRVSDQRAAGGRVSVAGCEEDVGDGLFALAAG